MRVHDQGLSAAGLDCLVCFDFLIVNISVSNLNCDLYIVKEIFLILAGFAFNVFLIGILIAVLPPDDNKVLSFLWNCAA